MAPFNRAVPRSTSTPSARAAAAFLAGYPLATTVRTMQTFAAITGVNKLLRTASLGTPTVRLVVAPNHDALYALAILDLRAGPQALTVPKIDRYYTFLVIDAWMDTVTNIGTRGTKAEPGTWVFTPPGSTVHLPAGAHEVKATTNQLVLLGRVRANDDADAPAAYAATADVKLQPLAAITGGATQPEAPPMAKTPGTPQTVGANGLGYFDELGDALAVNPPTDEQRRTAIDGAKSLLGVGPGRHATSDPGADQATLTQAAP